MRALLPRLSLALVLATTLAGCATAPTKSTAPATSLAPAVVAPAVDPRTMTFPPLQFEIRRDERFQLANGMIVHLLTDRELPLVNITAYVNTGSLYEPADKVGLAGLTGAVMRSGGTRELAPEKLDAELEFMASSVESSIGGDAGNVSLATLKKNLDRSLELFAQVLREPAFREDRVELARKRTLEGLRRQNDDPKGIADRELNRAIYAGHPFGRVPTPESIKAITRDDLIAFHRQFYRPNNAVLAVSGDIGRAELEEKLNKVVGGWEPGPVDLPRVAAPLASVPAEVLYARKEVNQSVVRMGNLGIEKSNPDLYALRVMDYILGGGFTSRLTTEIRSNQGLAYNADSYLDVGRRVPGIFKAETETKTESTGKAIGLMEKIIAGMGEAPVSDAELELARSAIINSFIFGFVRPDSIVNQWARLEFYGYPPGYLENYRDNIGRVSKEDVQRVSQKYLKPKGMVTVVVGDIGKLDQPLATFGTVREIKLEEFK